jgi:hypothetical protein
LSQEETTEQQTIRDGVPFGPEVTMGVALVVVGLAIALLVHARPDSVKVVVSMPELLALPLLLIVGVGTRFGSSKLCRIEIGEEELTGRTFTGKRVLVRWRDVTKVVIAGDCIEFSTPYSFAEISRGFSRFDEVADFVQQQCARRGIKCRDEPEIDR